MSIDETIELLQAEKKGKQIQRRNTYGSWVDVSLTKEMKEARVAYRVKPEPREWLLEFRGGKVWWPVNSAPCDGEREMVRVREVLE